MYDFGLKLRELRKKHNMTQKKLADKLNITEGSISKYESNTATPPFDTLLSIAAIFNVSIDELCGTQQRGVLSLHGLSDEQVNILQDLSDIFRNNSNKKLTPEQYNILGRVVAELTK